MCSFLRTQIAGAAAAADLFNNRGSVKATSSTAIIYSAQLPRLVLGWIEADFDVQIRIFQHFSKSTRKSPPREQIWQISEKKQNFLTFFGKIFRNPQNFCRFFFFRILQESVDFEKC